MKYIDVDKLKEVVDRVYNQYVYDYGLSAAGSNMRWIYNAIDSLQQEMWKPSEEQITAAKSVYSVLKSHDIWGEDEHLPILMSLINDLQKLL